MIEATSKIQDQKILKLMIKAQENEITEHFIYKKLAERLKDENNKKIIERIAQEELNHYQFWKSFTHQEVRPNKIKILFYSFLISIFGVSFGAKMMERGEKEAQILYEKLKEFNLETANFILQQENQHEQEILSLIDQKYLEYSGSFVLGLSDAIIELSGVLIGLTFALQKTNLIALVGAITGIAASLSMAGSEYLSTKEEGDKHPLTASFFTGLAYLMTVLIMIFPYIVFDHYLKALITSLILALIIIFIFNFYIAIAKNVKFLYRFGLMILIVSGVAVINFLIGILVRKFFGIEV